jgi:hypothetical protein
MDEISDYGVLGRNIVWCCRWIRVFRRNILPPSSGLNIDFCLYGLLNDSVSSSHYIASNDRMISEWWIGRDMEGVDGGLVWGTIWRVWRKSREASVKIAGRRAEVWTRDLLSTKQHCYRYDWYDPNHRHRYFLLICCLFNDALSNTD